MRYFERIIRLLVTFTLLLGLFPPASTSANSLPRPGFQTEEPSATPPATDTPTPVATETPMAVPTDTATALPSDTVVPTDTPTTSASDTPTPVETAIDTATPLPTDTPTLIPGITETPTPLPPPAVDFAATPLTGSIPLTITFVNSSTYATHFLWDFGDGITSTETISAYLVSPAFLTTTHLYTHLGVYTISLTATGPGGSQTLTQTNYLTATEPALADFSAFPTSGPAPLTVQFLDHSTGADRYDWDFGDGSTLHLTRELTDTLLSPSHTYTQAGVYDVTLLVGNAVSTHTLVKTGYITVTATTAANFNAAPRHGYAPLSVTFANHSLGATDYLWDFGDGQTSTEVEPVHHYVQAGVYTITLQASGPAGTDTLVQPAYLTVTQPISPAFAAFPYNAQVPGLIQFLNNSAGTIDRYAWDFGDGLTSTLPSPTHTYLASGVYTVSLTASGLDDSQTLTKTNYITITAPIEVRVADTGGQVEVGLPVYAFNGTTYTGYSQTTNSAGGATFTLPVGSYRFRADKNGTPFWSGSANHCPMPGCTSANVTTSIPLVVRVTDTSGQAEANLPVYVFTGNTYANFSQTTNSSGVVTFTLPLGDYRFRADKNGTQFWSGMTNHCPVPGCAGAVVTTTVPVVVRVANTSGQAEANLPVYAFTGSAYTNFSKTTNSAGVATFTLPIGEYRFRADKNGTQFWSGAANHCSVPGCTTTAVTTSIPVRVTVTDGANQPEANLPVYVFNGNTYTNYSQTSNSSGVVTFTLPLGEYRFRADKNGTQFWSDLTNHCPVPGCVSAAVTTSVPVLISVVNSSGQVEAGLPVYAFNGPTYTGYSKTTNAGGQAAFTLPSGEYRFRADKNGTQFWSGSANHCSVPGCVGAVVTTTIPIEVRVTDPSGQAEIGLAVYAFNGITYTNYSQTTNSSGVAIFTLPVGDYRFRADKNGTQFWSGTMNHCTLPGCANAVVTTTTPVVVQVTDTSGQAEAGLSVYAFSGNTYTNYSQTTNSTGVITFTLPVGDYHFRADKNGTQFWSGTTNHCTVPGCSTAAVTTTIPVVVSVTDTNGQAEVGLPVYAFNGNTYTNYSQTTGSTGVVTFTLPLGEYRFRADKSGTQYWSGAANHCPIPGCTSLTLSLAGPAQPPVVDFTATPLSGVVPLTITFTNISSGATTFAWNFGDGSTTTAISPTHTYTQAGTYTITLTATGPGGSNTLTRTDYITAYEPVVADFSASPLTGTAPLTVTFSNHSTGATDYLWDFGTGAILTVINPTYTFAQPGVYTITLTARGPSGATTSVTRTNYLTVTEPVKAGFSATPLTGTVPLTITFSNSSTGASSYLWDFGDGTTDTEINPSHTYAAAGVYTITLSAGDGTVTDTLPLTNYIAVYEPVIADFSATPLTGTAPLTVTFVNSSTGATDYIWDFGTGAMLTVVSPTYTYAQPGIYTVTLTANGPGDSDTLTRTHYITVTEPPMAAFSASPLTGTVPLTVSFVNSSTNATNYLWDFGDAISSTLVNPIHTYTEIGVYTVSLTADNGVTSNILTQPEYITVLPDTTPLTVTATSPLSNGLVIASNEVISVTFSRPVNSNTVNSSTFTVRGQQTGLHTGVYTVTENVVQFEAATGFKPGEEIVVNLSEQIQSSGGMTLTPYTWQFRANVVGGVGLFSDSGQRLTSTNLQEVVVGDLDGDGDLDAFVGNNDNATVWLNNGTGEFSDSGQSLSYADGNAVALGDLDNDGDLDAFIGNSGPNTVWLNDGNGNFSDSGQSLGGSITLAVRLGDLDGDGDLDAFVGDGDGNRVWLNDGAGVFSDSSQSLGNSENYAVTLADLDSDGDLDALARNSNDNRIWLNDGLGNFSDSGHIGNSYSTAMGLGDLDGDGDLDALVADYDFITLWRNDGLGNFSADGQNLSITNAQDIALGDLDGDDDLDAFISSYDLNQVWLNDGLGNFNSSQNLGNLSSQAVALGDLDSDGDLDAFVGKYYQANQIWLNQAPFTVTTTTPPGNDLIIAPDSIVSATFSRASNTTTVTTQTFTIRGSQTGVYSGVYLLSDDSPQFTGAEAFKPGEEIVVNLSRGIKAADGVSLTPYAWQFRAAVGGGAGRFVDSQQRLGNTNSYAVALGDLDSDGDLDAFVGNYGAPNQVWWGDALGNFTESGQSLGDTNTQAVALGDLDGDSDLDAFVGTAYYGSQVWLNDGLGSFSDSGQSLGSENNRAVALADLDGDGDLDAFIANQGSSEVWWNDGAGNFNNSNQSLSSSNAITLGDLDNDGDLDAFGSSYGGIVWFNDGAGYFSDSEYLNGSFETLAVDLGDLDGDGDLDAFLGNVDNYGQDSSNQVWLNDGTGNFSNTGQSLGNADTYAVALGDLDGDGDLDAFASNYGQDDGGGGQMGSISRPAGAAVASTSFAHTYRPETAGFVSNESPAEVASVKSAIPQLDIIAGTQGNQVWLNDGQGNFSSNGQLLGRANSRAVALGDLDGDGDLDAFVGNDYEQNGDNSDEVWLNQMPLTVTSTHPTGNGLVITPTELISATFSGTLSSSTITTQTFTVRGSQTGVYEGIYTLLDDSVQFTSTRAFNPGEEIMVSLNSGIQAENGSWLTPYAWQFRAAVEENFGRFSDSGQRLDNSATNAVALGDLDSDGDLDVFVGNSGGPNTVWLNDGVGNLSDTTQSLGSGGGYAVALGDLDGDGDLDALTAEQVWLNDSTGNFSEGYYLGYSANTLALGDLDGDGDLDAMMGDGGGSQVWLNDGAGNFNFGQNVNYPANTLALGDLDSDGDLDALISYYDGSQVWLNDGSANFSQGQLVSNSSAYTLAIGDLDGDGDLDTLIGTDHGYYYYSYYDSEVWLNNGTGSFSLSQSIGHSSTRVVTSLGDTDGDGDLDAIESNYDGANLIWLNNGAGNFSNSGQNLGGSNSRTIALGDLDRDGDLDAFVGNDSEQTNQVWLKQTLPDLTASKTAPVVVIAGEPITYTITVTNGGQLAVTNLVVTDTIPDNATYLTGGIRTGNVITWSIPTLTGRSEAQVSYVVTAATTINTSDYWISTNEGYTATSSIALATFVVDFVAEPIVGLAPLSVTFSTAAIPTEEISDYLWSFGDGTTLITATGSLTEATPALPYSHVYTQTGVYTVSLTAMGSGGNATLTRAEQVSVIAIRRDWQLITSPVTPTVVGEQAMSYDAERDVVTLYGGNATGWPYENSTWEFNPDLNWITTTIEALPTRYGAGMAYDPVLQRMVLFGGSDTTDTPLSQTWEYSGTSWVELTPAASPSRRVHSSMVAGPAGKTYLFGGNDDLVYYQDLWVYEDGIWSDITPPGDSPPKRTLAALAYDPIKEQLLLFGGRSSTGQLLADLWTFDLNQGVWTEMAAIGPSARQAHTLTYDPDDQLLILVGGTDASSDTRLNDTWYYQERVGWWQVTPALSLPGQAYHQAVYDSTRHTIILFSNRETWEYE